MSATPHYRPEIDGLRAIAVAAVVLFHAGVPGFRGGFRGVDVFFVISGYLIAGIVLRETEAGTFSFAKFYERRVRRIMPALLAMLAASAVLSLMLLPDDMVYFDKSLIAASAFASNFYFLRTMNYFAPDASAIPLLHTWSLAAEEQLYLVMPACIFAAARFGRRALAGAMLALAVLALAAAVPTANNPLAAFYLPFLRAVEFLLGAFLAAGFLRPFAWRTANEVLAAAGVAGLIYAFIFWPIAYSELPFGAAMAAVSTAFIIHGTEGTGNFAARALGTRPLTGLGLISYSLYLWHWPVLVFGAYYILEPSALPAARIVLAAASVPLAYLSWRYIEQPFRRPGAIFSRRGAFAAAAGASVFLAAFGALFLSFDGAAWRFGEATRPFLPERAHSHSPCDGQSPKSIAQGKLCRIGDPAAKPEFVFWGDSHADMYYEAIDALARRHHVAGYFFSAPECKIGLFISGAIDAGDCVPRAQAVLALIERRHPKAVVIAERWLSAVPVAATNDPITIELTERYRAIALKGYGSVFARLNRTGARTYLVVDVPEARAPVATVLAKAKIRGLDLSAGLPQALQLAKSRREYDRDLSLPLATLGAAARRANVTLLNLRDLLCPSAQCRVAQGGVALYRDRHHLSLAGARHVMPAFEPVMDHLETR